MKTWVLIFSAALFVGGTCLGVVLQPKLAPIDRAARTPASAGGRYSELSFHRFASELALSEEQDRALDDILGDTHQDSQALGRAQRALQEKSRERVLALLSAEQKAKLETLIAEERSKRSDAEIARKVAIYGKFAGLQEPQAKALQDALTTQRTRRRDYFRDRRHGGDHAQMRSFLKTLKDETNAAIAKALTPEQYAKVLELSELDD